MRKLLALVFSVAALAAGASPAWANLGRDHSGSPGDRRQLLRLVQLEIGQPDRLRADLASTFRRSPLDVLPRLRWATSARAARPCASSAVREPTTRPGLLLRTA